ncbi:hypothetical protein AB0C13_37220 [Streptomyces sp. NPDC049099]|uniref:hypothetical protein n=1 Tax=Streptomyces sp. NPDC049099 TaxID=3155768 RepID=UPI0034315A39
MGLPVGLAQSEYEQVHAPGWGSFYLIGLSLVSELLAFLTLGLVQSWGETWPRWIPYLRGDRVPAHMEASLWGTWLLNIAYAPLLLWGPLLGAVTVHYYRRRTTFSPVPVERPVDKQPMSPSVGESRPM